MTPILSTAYLAPIAYYALLMHYDKIIIEANEHYNKQSYRNRTFIGTDQGPLSLSIPVVKGYEIKSPIREVKLSDHGEWRHQHLYALASNYGNTPFYEYYIDELRQTICHTYTYLFELNEALRQQICDLIGIKPNVFYSSEYVDARGNANYIDLRDSLHPKKNIATVLPSFFPKPYYQVVGTKRAFMPNLSILDLLFNMGPESILVLRDSFSLENNI